jgi:two-component system chemotaxis response regulator CheY
MRTPKDIMVIDDDADIREAIGQVLELEGYSVVSAKDGRDGLEKLQTIFPKLILLDLMMPVMNGIEFKMELNAIPDLAPIPVVVLSADSSIQEKSSKIGVPAYLKKPVSVESLVDLVKRFCRTEEAM